MPKPSYTLPPPPVKGATLGVEEAVTLALELALEAVQLPP